MIVTRESGDIFERGFSLLAGCIAIQSGVRTRQHKETLCTIITAPVDGNLCLCWLGQVFIRITRLSSDVPEGVVVRVKKVNEGTDAA